jgi:hypothetical protein
MTLFRKKVVFAAAIETTIGTAVSIDATHGVYNAYNFELQPDMTPEERLGQGGAGRLSSVPVGRKAIATFRTDMAYNGTDIQNWALVLFPACGVINTTGTFAPLLAAPGASVKTATIARYCDGKRRIMYGAVGTFQMVFPTGRMAYIDWTFEGIWGGETDTAMITPNYPNVAPLRVSGGATTYDSVNLCMESCTFDVGNVITGLECNNGGESNNTGFEHFVISDRNPRITGNPQSKLVATQDRYGQFFNGTEAAFSLSIAAPSSSAITLAAPKAQIVSISEGDRNGVCIDEIEWQCNKNVDAADQEFSIAFS